MRILLTGAGGQVGRELVDVFAGHDVTAVDHRTLDIADRDAALGAVTSLRPDVIVNSAAYTAVDACETETDTAWAVNALAVRHLADGARRVGAGWCTCRPTTSSTAPSPSPTSSGTRRARPRCTDAPSSAASGSWGPTTPSCAPRGCAATTAATWSRPSCGWPASTTRSASSTTSGATPPSPTTSPSVVHRLVVDRRPGLFHVTNQGAVSWFEFARAVLEAAGLDPDRVHPVATADLQPARPAPRPANSVLDNAALRLSGLPLAPDFHEPLARLVTRLLDD